MPPRNRLVAASIGLLVLIGASLAPTSAQADVGTATISGVITAPGGGVPDAAVKLLYCGQSATLSGCFQFQPGQYTYDAVTGAYSGTGIPAGHYYFEWHYLGSTDLSLYYQNGILDYQTAQSHPLTVADGASLTQNIAMLTPATISGTITGFGGANIGPGTVTALRLGDSTAQLTSYPAATINAATGNYSITGLMPGTYDVTVTPSGGAGWGYGFVNNLVIAAGEISTTNVVLDRSAMISGHVYVDDGTGPKPYQGAVSLTRTGISSTIQSAADGSFSTYLPDVDSYLCIAQTIYVRSTCWSTTGSNSTPSPIHLALNQTQGGYDITAEYYGSITAFLQGQLKGSPFDLQTGGMQTWRLDESTDTYSLYGQASGGGNGSKATSDYLPAGTYRVEFLDTTGGLSSVWWDNKRYFYQAQDIQVVAGQTVDLGNVVLRSRVYDVYRTFGDDRFSGAVEMTKAIWAPPTDTPDDGGVPADGVPIIYIANGLNYPDALSAGPAAIMQRGALLLVWPTSIPDSVSAELKRLKPQKIAIVGGPASVSDGVMHQLEAFVPAPKYVSRLNGIDRFEASRNLAESVFGGPRGPGATTVFIATGLNFPDALDAGPPAGLIGAPVILVNGLLPTLDPDTAKLLGDLGTTDVYIAGGPGSVSPGIEAALIALMGDPSHVHRFTGETRYEAAAAIDEWFFPSAETVFLATGANFPDALAGAPLAGAVAGPIYLSQPDCIPQIVVNQIIDGDTQGIWLLGGPASISPDVEALQVC